jgi:hypothetical protein
VERGPSSFCLFASGALVPVLPYLFGAPGWAAVVIPAALVGIALLGTGAVVGLLSGASRSSERCASLPSDGMRGGYISHLASPGDYASATWHGIPAPLAAMFLIRHATWVRSWHWRLPVGYRRTPQPAIPRYRERGLPLPGPAPDGPLALHRSSTSTH